MNRTKDGEPSHDGATHRLDYDGATHRPEIEDGERR